MNEREALGILIHKSDFLTNEMRALLIDHLPSITDNDVRAIGTFLAEYQRASSNDAIKQKDAVQRLLTSFSQ